MKGYDCIIENSPNVAQIAQLVLGSIFRFQLPPPDDDRGRSDEVGDDDRDDGSSVHGT